MQISGTIAVKNSNVFVKTLDSRYCMVFVFVFVHLHQLRELFKASSVQIYGGLVGAPAPISLVHIIIIIVIVVTIAVIIVIIVIITSLDLSVQCTQHILGYTYCRHFRHPCFLPPLIMRLKYAAAVFC